MLTLNNISYYRNENRIFKDVGYTFGDKALVVVRGGNGSGKTTLLRIVAGLIKPSKGDITYAFEKVNKHMQEYHTMVNYIGHKNAVNTHLTVIQNLEFWAKINNALELVPAALKYFELEELADMECYKLSAGWLRKVALSRLMLSQAEIWLLDEPFNYLDEKSKNQLASLISVRCNQGGVVIVASHSDVPIKDYAELNIEDFK